MKLALTTLSAAILISSTAMAQPKKKKNVDVSTTAKSSSELLWDINLGNSKFDSDEKGSMSYFSTGVYKQISNLPLALGGSIASESGEMNSSNGIIQTNGELSFVEFGLGAKAWIPESVVGKVFRPYAKLTLVPFGSSTMTHEITDSLSDEYMRAKIECDVSGYRGAIGAEFLLSDSFSLGLEHNRADRELTSKKGEIEAVVSGQYFKETSSKKGGSEHFKTTTNALSINFRF